MKEGNEVNTFAKVISGYESYRVQGDLFSKLADIINQTEIANKNRKPGYLIIPAHAGKGKTRTLGEIVKAAMQNGLQGRLSQSLNNTYHKKLQHPFGLIFTFNDKMMGTLMGHSSFIKFREGRSSGNVVETDLVE